MERLEEAQAVPAEKAHGGSSEKTNSSTSSARGQDLVPRHFSRRLQVYLIGEGVLVGLLGGAVVTLYRLALSLAEQLLRQLTGLALGIPLAMAGWFCFLAMVCFVVCRLMLWEPDTQGSGIPQTVAEVMGGLDMSQGRVMVAKFLEGSLCTLCGLSLGREGPSVQLGGMSGKTVSRFLHRGRGEERILTTCGAAAGMAAAFNAPLTGVLFALEEIHKQFTGPLIITVMAAAVSSDFLVSQVLGVQPVLSFSFVADLPHVDYLFVIAMGIFCGLLGAAHNQGMFACQKIYAHIQKRLPYARVIIAFLLSGIVAFVAPEFLCGGDAIVDLINAPGLLPLSTLALLLAGKYLFTTICFASGAPGGTLFPLCVMGMLCGALFGMGAVNLLDMPPQYVTNFIVLGIGGLFAGVVRAPVTAVVLAFELTGSLDALLSVSIVSILAYVTANLLGVDPFYEHLLAALLGTTADDPELNGAKKSQKVLHTHEVGLGCPAEDKTLAEIAWPEGSRVVSIERAGVDIVPTGKTRLAAFDSVLVIMNARNEETVQSWCRSEFKGSLKS